MKQNMLLAPGDGKPIPTHSELIVVSPYVIASRHARQHLGAMHRRSVRVTVLTRSLALRRLVLASLVGASLGAPRGSTAARTAPSRTPSTSVRAKRRACGSASTPPAGACSIATSSNTRTTA